MPIRGAKPLRATPHNSIVTEAGRVKKYVSETDQKSSSLGRGGVIKVSMAGPPERREGGAGQSREEMESQGDSHAEDETVFGGAMPVEMGRQQGQQFFHRASRACRSRRTRATGLSRKTQNGLCRRFLKFRLKLEI